MTEDEFLCGQGGGDVPVDLFPPIETAQQRAAAVWAAHAPTEDEEAATHAMEAWARGDLIRAAFLIGQIRDDVVCHEMITLLHEQTDNA